jgi:uncharacterized membrane protein
MTDLNAMLGQLETQATAQVREAASLQRTEAAKSTAFELELNKVQTERAEANVFRKEMNDLLADVMKVLKSTGDQIRQSG